MRQAVLLALTAVLVAACAAADPPALGSGNTVEPTGLIGTQGSPGSRTALDIAPWTAYQDFDFDSASVDVSISDTPKLRAIVDYLESNPSLDVGIDGTLGTKGGSQGDRNLSERRAAAVRRALMDTGAGVASYKILMGPFADPNRRRSGQIQVWVGPRMGSPSAAL